MRACLCACVVLSHSRFVATFVNAFVFSIDMALIYSFWDTWVSCTFPGVLFNRNCTQHVGWYTASATDKSCVCSSLASTESDISFLACWQHHIVESDVSYNCSNVTSFSHSFTRGMYAIETQHFAFGVETVPHLLIGNLFVWNFQCRIPPPQYDM